VITGPCTVDAVLRRLTCAPGGTFWALLPQATITAIGDMLPNSSVFVPTRPNEGP